MNGLFGALGRALRSSTPRDRIEPSPESPPIAAKAATLPPPDVESIVRVEEVDDARFFINDLFRRRFGSDAPDYPSHFVAFHAAGGAQYGALGYVHYSRFEDSWLCGGMVMDDRAYRRVPAHHRAAIKAAGGVAEIMLRTTFARLRDAPAIWGYVGDKLAEVVDLRAGFVHTTAPHVMVVWNRPLSDAEKAERLAKVVALGPF
jgi:hypothetical protein